MLQFCRIFNKNNNRKLPEKDGAYRFGGVSSARAVTAAAAATVAVAAAGATRGAGFDGGGRRRSKETAEGRAELFAHRAVEREVDRVVDERHDVHRVTERYVVRLEEAGHKSAAHRQNALRQLGGEEQDEDDNEHSLNDGKTERERERSIEV